MGMNEETLKTINGKIHALKDLTDWEIEQVSKEIAETAVKDVAIEYIGNLRWIRWQERMINRWRKKFRIVQELNDHLNRRLMGLEPDPDPDTLVPKPMAPRLHENSMELQEAFIEAGAKVLAEEEEDEFLGFEWDVIYLFLFGSVNYPGACARELFDDNGPDMKREMFEPQYAYVKEKHERGELVASPPYYIEWDASKEDLLDDTHAADWVMYRVRQDKAKAKAEAQASAHLQMA